MTQELTEQQMANRFRNRRKMAWVSFGLLAVVGTGLISFGLSGDEAAKRVNDLSFIIATVFGVWASIVLAYFGVSAYVDTRGFR